MRGFRETAAGHLITNFSVSTVDYSGDPGGLAHISLVRNQGGRRAVTMRSEDCGRSWHFLSRVNDFGAPAAPLLLADGRVVMIYANRLRPSIRAVVSEDAGRSWSPEIIVREDGGSWDIGYPRAWEASPGRIGALYYFNTRDDPVQVKPAAAGPPWGEGGVRFIARSFFSID